MTSASSVMYVTKRYEYAPGCMVVVGDRQSWEDFFDRTRIR